MAATKCDTPEIPDVYPQLNHHSALDRDHDLLRYLEKPEVAASQYAALS